MKAIRLNSGVIFVEWGGFSTYRYNGEAWEVSPVLYNVVEWELRGEPDRFEYLTEGDIRALAHFDALSALHKKTCEILGWRFEEEQ